MLRRRTLTTVNGYEICMVKCSRDLRRCALDKALFNCSSVYTRHDIVEAFSIHTLSIDIILTYLLFKLIYSNNMVSGWRCPILTGLFLFHIYIVHTYAVNLYIKGYIKL